MNDTLCRFMHELHQRLLGTWRSHKAKTLATSHRYHSLPLRQKRVIAGCFGKRELHFTPKFMWCSILGTRERYEVKGAEEGSPSFFESSGTIVIRVEARNTRRLLSETLGELAVDFIKPNLIQIHFHESRGREYFWFGAGEFCEWFVKSG